MTKSGYSPVTVVEHTPHHPLHPAIETKEGPTTVQRVFNQLNDERVSYTLRAYVSLPDADRPNPCTLEGAARREAM